MIGGVLGRYDLRVEESWRSEDQKITEGSLRVLFWKKSKFKASII
jgi:hypothetical protein